MPQHQLIPTEVDVTGVSITMKEPPNPSQTGFEVAVVCHYSTGIKATVFMKHYSGFEVDLLTDLAMEAASAFLFGERGDVARACLTNWKVARAHAKKHEADAAPF